MKLSQSSLATVLFVLYLLYGCQSDPNQPADDLFSEWDSDQTPGVAAAVIKDNEIVYRKGFGQANLEYGIPITSTTVFHIASVSKQFTVFALLLLEAEGKLSLDDDIREYIPEVPDFGKTITLRHLASHTSGLRDQWELLVLAGWRMDDVITKEHILNLISRQESLNFDPGEQFMYCNTGFTLLAEVVARVSGQSFADFTQERIFTPLGMENTLFYDDHEKLVEDRAYSYYEDSTGYKKSVLNYANVGATSLFTTVVDLSNWASNFQTAEVGDTSMFATMRAPTVLNSGDSLEASLGQFVGEYKGLREIQHGGADAGYRSYLSRFPDQQLSVMVFSNDASVNAGGLAHQLADIYLGDAIEAEPEEEPSDSSASEVTVDEAVLATYVGDYEIQPGFTLNISNEQGSLFAKIPTEPRRSLAPLSASEFLIDGLDGKATFQEDSSGQIASVKLEVNGQTMEAPLIKPLNLSTEELSEYTGRYYSEELGTTYRLVVTDNQLVAKHIRASDIALKPRSEDLFNSDSWAFGEVQFLRSADDDVTGFSVSSGRVKNLQFTKVDDSSQ